jgi:hypothetical protein
MFLLLSSPLIGEKRIRRVFQRSLTSPKGVLACAFRNSRLNSTPESAIETKADLLSPPPSGLGTGSLEIRGLAKGFSWSEMSPAATQLQ